MSTYDTSPTSTDVLTQLAELLEEVYVAGGEIVLTCQPGTIGRWTVQLLTDVRDPGEPCGHAGQDEARYLADAISMARENLAEDQNLVAVRR